MGRVIAWLQLLAIIYTRTYTQYTTCTKITEHSILTLAHNTHDKGVLSTAAPDVFNDQVGLQAHSAHVEGHHVQLVQLVVAVPVYPDEPVRVEGQCSSNWGVLCGDARGRHVFGYETIDATLRCTLF